MKTTNNFLTRCIAVLGASLNVFAAAPVPPDPNGGFEVFCHDTPNVGVNLNAVSTNVAGHLALLRLVPGVDATATYAVAGVNHNYYVTTVAAPGAAPALAVAVQVAPLNLFNQAHLALIRNAMGIQISPPFLAALVAAMPALAPIAGAGAPAAVFAGLAQSLIRGGYANFLAAFSYRVRSVGAAFLGINLPAVLPNAICVGLKISKRASKNLKEVHWLSLPLPGPALPSIKWIINANYPIPPNSATLVYYTNQSVD